MWRSRRLKIIKIDVLQCQRQTDNVVTAGYNAKETGYEDVDWIHMD
jgi:hypothetical protein